MQPGAGFGVSVMTGSSYKRAEKEPIRAAGHPVPAIAFSSDIDPDEPTVTTSRQPTTAAIPEQLAINQPIHDERPRASSLNAISGDGEQRVSTTCNLRVRPEAGERRGVEEEKSRRLSEPAFVMSGEDKKPKAARSRSTLGEAVRNLIACGQTSPRDRGEREDDVVETLVASAVGRREAGWEPTADPFRFVGGASFMPVATTSGAAASTSAGAAGVTTGAAAGGTAGAAAAEALSSAGAASAAAPSAINQVPTMAAPYSNLVPAAASAGAALSSGSRVTMPPVGDGRVSAASHGAVLGRNTPIRPAYHRTRETTPNQAYYDHRRSKPDRRHAAPPITAGEYAAYARPERGGFFDAHRYAKMMYFKEGEKFVPMPGGGRIITAQEAWQRRWAHWAGRSNKEIYAVGLCDTFYLRCEQERNYQRRLSHLIEFLRLFPRKLPNVDLVMLSYPFDGWYSISQATVDAGHGNTKPSRVWWLSEVEFEERMRRPKRGRGANRVKVSGHAIGWEQVDNFAIPINERHGGYVTMPVGEQGNNEIGQIVPVPTAPVYAYATGVMMHDPSLSMSMYMVAASERIVLALMAFLAAAKYGGHHPRDGDPRISGKYVGIPLRQGHTADGVIVPIGKNLLEWWSDKTIVYLCKDTDFEPVLAMRAVDAARWTDWSVCDMPEESMFYRYDWGSGFVYELGNACATVVVAGQNKVVEYPATKHKWLREVATREFGPAAYHVRMRAAVEHLDDGSSNDFVCFPPPNLRVPRSVTSMQYCRRADVAAYGVFAPLPVNDGYPFGSGCGLAVTNSQPPVGYNEPHMPVDGGSAMNVNNVFSVGHTGPAEAPGVPDWVHGIDEEEADWGAAVDNDVEVGRATDGQGQSGGAEGVAASSAVRMQSTAVEPPTAVARDNRSSGWGEGNVNESPVLAARDRSGRRSREVFEGAREVDETAKRARVDDDDNIIRRFAHEQSKRADVVQEQFNELFKKNARLEIELGAAKEKLGAMARELEAAKEAARVRNEELKTLQEECARRERLADRFRRAGLAAHRQYRNEVLAAQSRMADNLEIFAQSKDESAE